MEENGLLINTEIKLTIYLIEQAASGTIEAGRRNSKKAQPPVPFGNGRLP